MGCRYSGRQSDKQKGRQTSKLSNRLIDGQKIGRQAVSITEQADSLQVQGLTLGGQPSDHRLHAPGCQAGGALHALLVCTAYRGHQGVGFLGAGVGLLEALTGAAHHRQLQDPLQHVLLLLEWKESRYTEVIPPPPPTSWGGSPRAMEPIRAGLGPRDLGETQTREVSGGPTGKTRAKLPCSPGHNPGSGELLGKLWPPGATPQPAATPLISHS